MPLACNPVPPACTPRYSDDWITAVYGAASTFKLEQVLHRLSYTPLATNP